ncbi:acyloxyacyl hydrolase [Pseudothauera rhizosphaerae]|nr:acyloxyacyl hydrolase [Pseudothauera rhizosphaerae]
MNTPRKTSRTFAAPFCRVLLAAAVAACTLPAAAQDGPELVLKHGRVGGGGYQRTGLGLRLGSVWENDWGGWHLSLRPEFELSRFSYDGSRGRPDDRLTQGGAIGLLRAYRGNGGTRPYGEVGLGVAMFSGDRLGSKDISTHFQFSQHLGAGLEFSGRWNLGLQYSHYSNGDIEKPNDGMDVYQVLFGVRF